MTRAARRAPMLAALAATVLAPLACFNESGPQSATGPKIVGFGGGTGGTNDGTQSSLVGSWSNTVVTTDSTGTRSTQTVWTFRADGTARRTTMITDAFTGVTTSSSVDALWQTNDSTLLVTFVPPAVGSISLDIQIAGTTLLINGVEFTRIA